MCLAAISREKPLVGLLCLHLWRDSKLKLGLGAHWLCNISCVKRSMVSLSTLFCLSSGSNFFSSTSRCLSSDSNFLKSRFKRLFPMSVCLLSISTFEEANDPLKQIEWFLDEPFYRAFFNCLFTYYCLCRRDYGTVSRKTRYHDFLVRIFCFPRLG